jgi:hypothetical protein
MQLKNFRLTDFTQKTLYTVGNNHKKKGINQLNITIIIASSNIILYL